MDAVVARGTTCTSHMHQCLLILEMFQSVDNATEPRQLSPWSALLVARGIHGDYDDHPLHFIAPLVSVRHLFNSCSLGVCIRCACGLILYTVGLHNIGQDLSCRGQLLLLSRTVFFP